jgi:hypothetical protein
MIVQIVKYIVSRVNDFDVIANAGVGVGLLHALVKHFEACRDVQLHFTRRLLLHHLVPKRDFIVECEDRLDFS